MKEINKIKSRKNNNKFSKKCLIGMANKKFAFCDKMCHWSPAKLHPYLNNAAHITRSIATRTNEPTEGKQAIQAKKK
jgi:hypothetical protein